MKYIIGRTYNRHGISDYYMGSDEAGIPMFSGRKVALEYTNKNTAYGMTIRLKRLLPVIIGGASASYSLVEIKA